MINKLEKQRRGNSINPIGSHHKTLFVFSLILLTIFSMNLSSALLIDDLVTYWKLDQLSGTLVDNISNINLTGVGSPLFGEPGIIETAIGINSPLQGFQNTSNSNLDVINFGTTQNFSFNLWVNFTAVSSGFPLIFDSNSLNDPRWAIFGGSGDTKISWRTTTTGVGVTLITNENLSINEYHMITGIRNNSGQDFFLFIDGVLNQSLTGQTPQDASSGNISLGNPFASRTLNSSIDEFGIWNRSLTSQEIDQLFNGGSGTTYPNFEENNITIILINPEDNSLISEDVTFNASLQPAENRNLTNATFTIWYANNGSIHTLETNTLSGQDLVTTSITVTNLSLADYFWNVIGCTENITGQDVSCSYAQNNFTFTWLPFSIDNEIFNTQVLETSRQDFLINITTLPTILSLSAILNYNGTRFTATTSCNSGLCQIETAIDIPLVSSGEFENKSFLWEITLFDGISSFTTNTTANEQNVSRIHYEQCNATFTEQSLNFTAFDEANLSSIDPFLFNGDFFFWIGTGTVQRNNSISESSVSSLQMCISPTDSEFFLDATIEYNEATGTNYTQRNYFFQNDTVNNQSQDIELGLLLAEDSTSFILKVQDRDILPVSDAVIFTQRFYPGEGIFRTVQVSQTSDDGSTIGFFTTETVEYRFIIRQEGRTVNMIVGLIDLCPSHPKNKAIIINNVTEPSNIKPWP